MRILVLQTGRREQVISATRAIAARHPEAALVGWIRAEDREAVAATELHQTSFLLPEHPGRLSSHEIWKQPFDACVVPFEDRLGVEYWHFRLLPLRHRIRSIYAYDRRGSLIERTWTGWLLNTVLISFAVRPVHHLAVRLWLWGRPHIDVAAVFGLAILALFYRGFTRLASIGLGRRTSAEHQAIPRRLVVFIPSLGVGGAQRQIVSFLEHVNRAQWDPELVTMKMTDDFFEPAIRELAVPIRYLNPHGEFMMTGVVWRLARRLRRHPCAVLHGWLHYSAALGAIAGSFAGVPTIVGSLRSERPGRFPWFYPRWRRALDVLTAPLLTYFIANSEAVREENRRWAFIPRSKLITIYNGLDASRLDCPDRDRLQVLKRELGLPPRAAVVGIVGRLFPEKDHHTFLQAARLVADVRADVHFLIVGDGALQDAIQREIKELRLDGHVHLLGNRKDVLAVIRLMDVHVLTSVSEGFPNVLLEAAAVGTPVVTTAAGGAAEVVEEGVSGYVVPCGDSDALAKRVLALLDDPALRRRIAQAARDRVASLFAAPRIVAAIEASYLRRAAPVRVCFISPYAYGFLNPSSTLPVGGAEVQVCGLAAQLARDPRFEVTILTGDGDRSARERRSGMAVILSPRLGGHQRRPGGGQATKRTAVREWLAPTILGTVKRWWDDRRSGLSWFWTLIRIRPAVVVMRCATPDLGAIQQICKYIGARLVFQVAHDQDVDGSYVRARGSLGQRFEQGLKRADAVICQHRGQIARLRAHYGIEGRLLHSLSPAACPPVPCTATNDRSIVLWMARLDRWKQPELFLDLAARMPEQRFVMVAPPSEIDSADSPRLRARLNGLSNLALVPGLSFQDALRLFEEALLFVNTSENEGFPNTFLQAAAAGTPIVSWSVDPDRTLERHEIGLCAGRNWDAFEQHVRRLCTDGVLRDRLGENGRRYVAAHHDPAGIAGQYAELFLALTEKNRKVEAEAEAEVEDNST
jgi:glycosyltransferase involved in cell wall biosynthesis